MRDLAVLALDEAVAAGARYADARALVEETERISVQGRQVEGVDRSTTRGVGVRVLVDDAWGFAGTVRLDPEALKEAARHAVAIARASATARHTPVRLAPVEARVDSWTTPHDVDPFTVPLADKLALLLAATEAAETVPGLAFAKASTDAWRTEKWFLSSDGADLHQLIMHTAGGVECLAVGDGEVQQRSYPNSFRGHCGSGGWEDVVALDLVAQAPLHAEQAVELLTAPDVPADVTTLILDGSQVALQVHESVGHPLELDRILGHEAAYAGTSFVSAADRGWLRYGSPQVSITLDSTTPGALGTFGYDDEGVPAGRHPLIVEGVLTDCLSSRETAAALGEDSVSNGTMRADSWAHQPLIRMSNIHLEPREDSLEALVAGTERGFYLSTNRSWSIDDKRINFQFGCEVAYEIRDGRLGRMHRNGTYTGRTTEFWGSCDGVAGPDEWRVYGTPNCGKGQPGQAMRVAHGAAPARFRGVQVGVGR
ncbi:TldD/PmbA family protein [soil metagenome]